MSPLFAAASGCGGYGLAGGKNTDKTRCNDWPLLDRLLHRCNTCDIYTRDTSTLTADNVSSSSSSSSSSISSFSTSPSKLPPMLIQVGQQDRLRDEGVLLGVGGGYDGGVRVEVKCHD